VPVLPEIWVCYEEESFQRFLCAGNGNYEFLIIAKKVRECLC